MALQVLQLRNFLESVNLDWLDREERREQRRQRIKNEISHESQILLGDLDVEIPDCSIVYTKDTDES